MSDTQWPFVLHTLGADGDARTYRYRKKESAAETVWRLLKGQPAITGQWAISEDGDTAVYLIGASFDDLFSMRLRDLSKPGVAYRYRIS